MWRQSETFIYHQGCAEAKPIPAELEQREKERVSEGQKTERGHAERKMSKEASVCLCEDTVEGQV